jgi:Fibronectin type III domain/Pentapeptide repeats (8 copies)
MTTPRTELVGSDRVAPVGRHAGRRRWWGLCLPVVLALAVVTVGTGGVASAHPSRVTKPSSPTPVSATPVEGGTTVSWGAPASDGGSPITGYVVKASHGGATCTTSGATTCTVTGLTDGHLYTVHVRALNVKGEGKPSPKAKVTAGQGPDCSAVGPGVDLAYCILPNANLNGADLDSANLTGARLTGANLDGANLNGATLHKTNFTNAHMVSTTLVGADLTGGYLIDSNLTGADLTDAVLAAATVTGADLTNADLTGSSLGSAHSVGGDIWANTTCPDGTNSDGDGGTCVNNES